MRWLAVETSCRRGSVALVDDQGERAVAYHEGGTAHGEALVSLLDSALKQADWTRRSIDAIAVGIGPGSFTGLRVGIAFCQGLSIALGKPLAGVGSLEAMCRAVPKSEGGVRCAVLDARRDEYFIAAYDELGRELVSPQAIAQAGAARRLEELCPNLRWSVGEAAKTLSGPWQHYRSEHADLPHATCVARAAGETALERDVAEPMYLRPVDAIRPKLPPSPLS